MKSRLVIMLVLGVTAAWLAGWLIDRAEILVEQEPLEIPDNIDYYLKTVNYRAFDAQGNLQYRLQSPYLEHHIREDTSQLTEPDINYFSAGDEWRLQARHGSLQHANDVFELTGQAQLQRLGSASPLALTSQRFVFDSTSETLDVPVALQLVTPAGRLHAQSARLDLANQLHRFHRVKASYHRESKDAG